MSKGRNPDKRSLLAGKRFGMAVNLFTSSYEEIIGYPRWWHFVGKTDVKRVREWPEKGMPLKHVDQVAEFFCLEAQAFIDERVDDRDLRNKLYELKQKVIDAGRKKVPLEHIEPPEQLTYPVSAVPAELSGSFRTFIKDRVHAFYGRNFVFDALDGFLNGEQHNSGYFLVTGDPGIGKSAIMAKLIVDRGYLHHFNIALQSINKPEQFLRSICMQLIQKFNLPYGKLPDDVGRDGALLNRLLAEGGTQLKPGEKLVIAIDALDEVDMTGMDFNANLLYLPASLPDNIYIVATSRRMKDMPLQAMNLTQFDIEANSTANKRDAAEYIKKRLEDEAMRAVLNLWEVGQDEFINAITEKSEGNFMYLRHVLPAIKEGDFKDGGLDELPQGLLNYYRHHWKQMRCHNPEKFDTIYQPVVCMLATVKEAVSLEQLHNFTKIEPMKIQNVIYEWYQFLHSETQKDAQVPLYRVYHTMFQEFLFKEIEPGLKPYHRMIADYYLNLIETEKKQTSDT